MREAIHKRLREAQRLLLPETKRLFGAMTYDPQTWSLISKDGKDRLRFYRKGSVPLDGRVIQGSVGSVVIERVPLECITEETIRIESP